MNIGFDLDKIFINHPPFVSDKLVDYIYKQKVDGKLLYRIPSAPEQFLRRISHTAAFRPPIKENIEFIESLAKQNTNKHYLVSGRFGFLKKRTETFIKRYKFDKIFDGMYFNYENKQPHEFKDTVIKFLKLDTFIDDDLELLLYLSEKNTQTNFFWFNRDREGEIKPNLFAITKLKQIIK